MVIVGDGINLKGAKIYVTYLHVTYFYLKDFKLSLGNVFYVIILFFIKLFTTDTRKAQFVNICSIIERRIRN